MLRRGSIQPIGHLRKPLAVLGLYVLVGSGCTASNAEPSGKLMLPQYMVTARGTYRLHQGTFRVANAQQHSTLHPTDDDEEALDVRVKPGLYTVELQDGWQLERMREDGSFEGLPTARLGSDNPIYAEVLAGGETPLGYYFVVDHEIVPFGDEPVSEANVVSQCGES